MQAEGSATTGRELVKTSTPGIFKRGGGYVVRFRDQHGKQRQIAAETLSEARRVKAEAKVSVDRKEFKPAHRTTFADYATEWIESYAGRTNSGLKSATISDYRRDIKRAADYFGRTLLVAIDPPAIKKYAKHLVDTGMADATVRRYMAPLKACLATAMEDGLIRTNPSAGVRLPLAKRKAVEESVKALNLDELTALIGNVPGDWRRSLVVLLAETGLRIGEALALTWGAIDVEGRRLHVRQRVLRGEIDTPKSARGRREVPISAATAKDLAAMRLASRFSTPTDYVFTNDAGEGIRERSVYRWFKPAAQASGVGWAGFHALRHTAASRWLHAGVSIAQVSKLLGHADASFTLRTYISVLPTDLPDGEALAGAVGARLG
jgi:integrase